MRFRPVNVLIVNQSHQFRSLINDGNHKYEIQFEIYDINAIFIPFIVLYRISFVFKMVTINDLKEIVATDPLFYIVKHEPKSREFLF